MTTTNFWDRPISTIKKYVVDYMCPTQVGIDNDYSCNDDCGACWEAATSKEERPTITEYFRDGACPPEEFKACEPCCYQYTVQAAFRMADVGWKR